METVAAYHSLFNKLLLPPDDTSVYPGHDYKGDTISTIGEEKTRNSRLQANSAEEYAEIMDNLNLADPKMMDVAITANLSISGSWCQTQVLGLILGRIWSPEVSMLKSSP